MSRRSIIIIDLLATDKSRYFAQPRPIIIVNSLGGIRENKSKTLEDRTDLITVFDAILGRQSGQNLQCLYGNPMAKTFLKIEL